MTSERVAQILYTSVYFVVRRAPPLPSLETFLDTRVKDLFVDPAPSDWPEFWRETLTAVLDDLLRREGVRADGLSPEFFENRNRRMRSIRDRIAKSIMPLEEPRADTRAPATAVRGPAPRRRRRPSGRLALWLVMLAAATATGALAADEPRATIEITPAERAVAGEGPYEIVVAFADEGGRAVEVPCDLIVQPARYTLRAQADPEQPLPITRAVWRGVGGLEGHALGAVLHARLSPEAQYRLWIDLPGVDTDPLRVAASATLRPAPPAGFVRCLRFLDRHVSGTLDLRTLENEERIGVDFRSSLGAPVARDRLGADAIRCGLRAEGMLAVSRRPVRAHNTLTTELEVSWLRTYLVPGPFQGSRHVHALGLQLAPLGVESDQDWRRVDLTLGPALTFSVPLLDWPLLAWHRWIEMPRGFLPPTVRVGYTHLHRVRDGGEPRDDRRRLDLEVTLVAPLLRPLDLLLRHRVYHDLESRRRRESVDLTWRWYVGRDSRTALLLKLVHGALPPLYDEVEVASLGFQVGL